VRIDRRFFPYTGHPEIGGAMPIWGLIGGEEAIDHEMEVPPKDKTQHHQICPAACLTWSMQKPRS
jgi:hypothetical protein